MSSMALTMSSTSVREMKSGSSMIDTEPLIAALFRSSVRKPSRSTSTRLSRYGLRLRRLDLSLLVLLEFVGALGVTLGALLLARDRGSSGGGSGFFRHVVMFELVFDVPNVGVDLRLVHKFRDPKRAGLT